MRLSQIFQISIPALLVLIHAPSIVHAQGSPVVVAEVIEREVNSGHRVVGTVMPIHKSTVGTAVDGRVVEYLVNLGDYVQANQPLAKLRTGTLEIELNSAQAELTLRQEELRELQNGSRPEEISEARARMLAAEAIQKNSLTRLNRLQ
ncbi:MAG: biotin/lipoyl-binding protein, partial [Fuerstiella sp.]|nr:biotin/lipoyl-binding protein [Fuerstiella sp.]